MTSTRRVSLFLLVLLLPFAAGAFQPFFDKDPRTLHAPEYPPLTDFDLEVLQLCGGWGAEVAAVDFERMMLKPANATVVERLRSALGNRVFSQAETPEQFVHELRRVWFEQKGFKHVFCGEPGEGMDLGGLHYAARYWQAQDKGWAGYRQLNANLSARPEYKCRAFYLKERIRSPIYSISVAFKNPREPANNVKCLTGYNREMSAEDILLAGTQAFKQASKRVGKNSKEACLFETRLDGKEPFYSTFVIKQRALRTFYPLAEKAPYCKKNKRDYRDCLCSNL
ncbi:MAG: EndoU domain-containing protein [Gammaproteobacteria bacterium]|nr:EndoU domain-containing protein [Gammaproteobacteria bacterium]MBU1653565.1 EndoU domain-containing protein [Gammaproteobacteria bacterium]MBU1961907.1 EndoU domain-containing protein [Gammaproteobacteria bacterium]